MMRDVTNAEALAATCPVRARAGVLAGLVLAAAGCGGEELPSLADQLVGMEFDAPISSAVNVSMGAFDVPVAIAAEERRAASSDKPFWMRLRFELSAETSPEFEASLKAAVEKRRGTLNDAVLTIVRTSTLDELNDPRLAAIKVRLDEATREMLGSRVRQFVINDPIPELLVAPPMPESRQHAESTGDDLADDQLADAPNVENLHRAAH